MNPDQLVALLMEIADLKLAVVALSAENAALRKEAEGDRPGKPGQPPVTGAMPA